MSTLQTLYRLWDSGQPTRTVISAPSQEYAEGVLLRNRDPMVWKVKPVGTECQNCDSTNDLLISSYHQNAGYICKTCFEEWYWK